MGRCPTSNENDVIIGFIMHTMKTIRHQSIVIQIKSSFQDSSDDVGLFINFLEHPVFIMSFGYFQSFFIEYF